MRQDGGRIEHALSILRRTSWDAFTLLLDVRAVAAAIFACLLHLRRHPSTTGQSKVH
jgi:hypothetical protein